jgi:hypothetical protein
MNNVITHLSTRIFFLRHDTAAIWLNLGDGEANVFATIHQALEAGIISTANVGRALD